MIVYPEFSAKISQFLSPEWPRVGPRVGQSLLEPALGSQMPSATGSF